MKPVGNGIAAVVPLLPLDVAGVQMKPWFWQAEPDATGTQLEPTMTPLSLIPCKMSCVLPVRPGTEVNVPLVPLAIEGVNKTPR